MLQYRLGKTCVLPPKEENIAFAVGDVVEMLICMSRECEYAGIREGVEGIVEALVNCHDREIVVVEARAAQMRVVKVEACLLYTSPSPRDS